MKNNKGFTLIEIISVIAILLTITVIAIPSITSIVEKNKEKNWTSIVYNIETSSENFIEYYRDDIPFNDDTYYFKLNVLASLNLIKFPIINPWTNEEISGDECIKVTKSSDGSLSYEFPATCSGNATTTNVKPTLELKTNKAFVKKGSVANLIDYVLDYSSETTPKRYLKLNIVDNSGNFISTLDTTLMTSNTETISYTVIDLLSGESSDSQSIEFTVVESNPKINVVLLSDVTTSKDLQSKDLNEWITSLENKLNETIIGDLEYEVELTIENSTLKKDIGVVKNSEGSVNFIIKQCSYSVSNAFQGVYGDSFLVFKGAQTNWCHPTGGDSTGENEGGAFSIIDLKNNESVLALQGINNCRHHESGNIYCKKTSSTSDWGMAFQTTGSTTIRYYEYVYNSTTNIYERTYYSSFVEGDYDSTAYKYYFEGYMYNSSKAMRERKASSSSWSYTSGSSTTFSSYKTKYENIKALFDESSDDWNTHTNPDEQLYLENFEIRDYETTYELIEDENETVVKIDDNTYGHLTYYEKSHSSGGPSIYPYVLVDSKSATESFSISLSGYNSTSPNKTYFAVLANKPSTYTQSITVSSNGTNIKKIIYGDATSQTNFGSKLTNVIKKSSYTNINSVLTDLIDTIVSNE